MSALCTVVVMGGPVVAGDAPPSAEKHLRMRFRQRVELSSDEGTTPEASTDSDNDSAFDFSDDETAGSKRGPPPTALPLGEAYSNARDLESGRWRHSRGSLSPPPRPQRMQPLPRRVRFKLDDNDKTINTTTTDQPADFDEYVQLRVWGGEQKAAIQESESALLALGMMSPTVRGGTARVIHGKRCSFGEAAAAATTGNPAIFSAPAPASAFSSSLGYRSQKTARKAAWNKRTVVLPLRRGDANHNANTDASSTSANTLANASINVKAIAQNSTPSSPKKRRMLPASSMLRLRARGGCGGVSGDKNKRRPLKGVGNLAELFKAAAAVSTTRSGSAPAPARPARSKPTPELVCEESLDVDAAMKPMGEVRTPICRLLLPCWPEGVEGYEEAGGWRRLGGATSQALPRGSR